MEYISAESHKSNLIKLYRWQTKAKKEQGLGDRRRIAQRQLRKGRRCGGSAAGRRLGSPKENQPPVAVTAPGPQLRLACRLQSLSAGYRHARELWWRCIRSQLGVKEVCIQLSLSWRCCSPATGRQGGGFLGSQLAEDGALEASKEEWNFVAECRRKGIPQAEYCKNGFVDTSVRLLERLKGALSLCRERFPRRETNGAVSLCLNFPAITGREFPDFLKEQTHLKEWHMSNTLIQIIPKYIELFQAMRILDLPKNQISRLPAEISCLKNLKELNMSFNRPKSIPPELGDCENLEKLDCSGNLELTELPFELSK
ncbi:unnamed protein product [Rangifer tarandus platyrhynchus]|uniref:Leucine rich repeat containing 2 n=1 Tax=Rangifer tarandus platyrhynchus TaxID=3082113 RepID=A0ABN9A677_RANTA|nr:unnamed protein product [Rangifer tarandus platyrhynchus]